MGKINLEDILNLEYTIYSPILKASGISATKQQMLENLKQPQEIFTYYKANKLVGVFRFSINKEKAFVLSLLYHSNNNLPRNFINKIISKLRSHNINTLESVVQKSNKKSIAFHQKLGFNVCKEYPKAIRFQIDFDLLNKRFPWL